MRQVSMIALCVGMCALQGCVVPMTMPVTQMTETVEPCMGGTGGDVGGENVVIEHIKWTDRVRPPAYDQLSPQFARYVQYAHARAKFLVVTLRLTNTTQGPIAWNNLTAAYFKSYRLISPEGTQYDYEAQNSSITMRAGDVNQNPGIPVEGTVVFDAPKGHYTFTVMNNQYGINSIQSTPVFQCTL